MLGAALLCSAAIATAQAPKSADQMDKAKGAAHEVTVTGCLATGPTEGSYQLTHAGMSDMMKDKGMMEKGKMEKGKTDAGKMDHDKMGAGKMASKDSAKAGHMMTYALVGGQDLLKPHLGHKIEVTGTTSQMDHMSTPAGTAAKESKDMKGAKMKDMKAATLSVKSMKMVSAACP
jgi:hypothetical protein